MQSSSSDMRQNLQRRAPVPSSRFGSIRSTGSNGHPSPDNSPTDEGLQAYTSPHTGMPVSEFDRSALYAQHRAEYVEVTRRRILPKIITLAQRLLPAVAAEMFASRDEDEDRQEVKERWGQRLLVPENATPTGGLKTTGLYDNDEDLEGGGGNNRSTGGERLCLPQSASLAATGLSTPEPSGSKGDVPVDDIAAGLSPDMALLDIEADALLASIRSEALAPSKRIRYNGEDDDERSITSYGVNDDDQSITSFDDDDMGGEIRRLGNVMASLQEELSGAGFEEMRRDRAMQDVTSSPGGHDDTASSGGTGICWGSAEASPSADKASNLKTWKAYGAPGFGRVSSHAPLYWAVALIWAVVILLAGHVRFSSLDKSGGLDNWPDLLEFFFGGRL